MCEILWDWSTWRSKPLSVGSPIFYSNKENQWCKKGADRFLRTQQDPYLHALPSTQYSRLPPKDGKDQACNCIESIHGILSYTTRQIFLETLYSNTPLGEIQVQELTNGNSLCTWYIWRSYERTIEGLRLFKSLLHAASSSSWGWGWATDLPDLSDLTPIEYDWTDMVTTTSKKKLILKIIRTQHTIRIWIQKAASNKYLDPLITKE